MAPRVTCHCGECQKCKHRAYMRAWYARPENTERHRETARQSRRRRIEQVREYDRERGYRVYDPAKVAARRDVRMALIAGELHRQPCEVCGAEKTDAHHDDHSKPLEVRWLCRSHHMELHQRVNPTEVAA